MKKLLLIPLALSLASCGENKKEALQREREENERDRQTLLELQRQENIQRQADRDQRAAETVIQGLDVLTR